MITKDEALSMGFEEQKHTNYSMLVVDDFVMWVEPDKLTLSEWYRGKNIDISHLDAEKLKILIALLSKSKD